MGPSARFWEGRTVLVTGHLGFKGAWLCQLLGRLGASTVGYGKDERKELLYPLLTIPGHRSVIGDINDTPYLRSVIETSGASILLHLAAQPIVLTSYQDPLGTFSDNVLGTASVLQAARGISGLEAIVVVTSDKVYRNHEWLRPYHEADELGGSDPYSASKAAAELVTSSMASSFFADPAAPVVATARAGNVIGGGDWGAYRLFPDAARAFASGQVLTIRNPASTRPWQHVLEPLCGYLDLARALVEQKHALVSRAWNFGPAPADALPVNAVMDMFVEHWGDAASYEVAAPADPKSKEAGMLAVDASLAMRVLGWTPRWRVGEAVRRTAHWYRGFAQGKPAQRLVDDDIDAFLSEGKTHASP